MSIEGPMVLEHRYRLGDPLDMDDARKAARSASDARRRALGDYAAAVNEATTSEVAYRKHLAVTLTTLRAQGQPVTILNDLARGDSEVARLKGERDLAAEMVWVFKSKLAGVDAEIELLRGLISWSGRTEHQTIDQSNVREPS